MKAKATFLRLRLVKARERRPAPVRRHRPRRLTHLECCPGKAQDLYQTQLHTYTRTQAFSSCRILKHVAALLIYSTVAVAHQNLQLCLYALYTVEPVQIFRGRGLATAKPQRNQQEHHEAEYGHGAPPARARARPWSALAAVVGRRCGWGGGGGAQCNLCTLVFLRASTAVFGAAR